MGRVVRVGLIGQAVVNSVPVVQTAVHIDQLVLAVQVIVDIAHIVLAVQAAVHIVQAVMAVQSAVHTEWAGPVASELAMENPGNKDCSTTSSKVDLGWIEISKEWLAVNAIVKLFVKTTSKEARLRGKTWKLRVERKEKEGRLEDEDVFIVERWGA